MEPKGWGWPNSPESRSSSFVSILDLDLSTLELDLGVAVLDELLVTLLFLGVTVFEVLLDNVLLFGVIASDASFVKVSSLSSISVTETKQYCKKFSMSVYCVVYFGIRDGNPPKKSADSEF